MSNTEIIYVNCPTCQKKVLWNDQSLYRPFCSKRCQLIDLGDWASEENRIPSDELISDNEIWSDDNISPLDRDDR
ncbi:DNA gyrase inhibitor YacG [Utexia brackfieldae]|uniref:DNA gyrase inhibitor YacG n=1 Tax=Utexia brackfieldae TaxID=3074108 RepID=UPI00370D2E82